MLPVAVGCLVNADGRRLGKGQFILLPRNSTPLHTACDSTVLQVTLPVD
jgi:hypothetical protein